MVQKEQKVNATIDKKFFYHPFFDYLDTKDREEIFARLSENHSVCIMFDVNGENVFSIVIDIMPEFLHVREVAGNLKHLGVIKSYQMIEIFTTGLAKACGYSEIRFRGERGIHKMLSPEFGFSEVQINEFSKMVH